MSAPPAETPTRRYNLGLPETLYNDLERVAKEQGTTVVELIRRFIKLGLLAIELQQSPGSGLIMRKDGEDHKVMLF